MTCFWQALSLMRVIGDGDSRITNVEGISDVNLVTWEFGVTIVHLEPSLIYSF